MVPYLLPHLAFEIPGGELCIMTCGWGDGADTSLFIPCIILKITDSELCIMTCL